MSLAKVTHSAIEKFRAEMIARAGTGHLNRAQAITSTNTYIRCVAREHYIGRKGRLELDLAVVHAQLKPKEVTTTGKPKTEREISEPAEVL